MRIRRRTVIVSSLIILGLAFLTIGVLMQKPRPKFYAHSLRNWQEADASPGYPIATETEGEFWTASFEPNLSHLRSMERYRLPVARQFTHPNGPRATITKRSPVAVEFGGPEPRVVAAGNGLVLAVTKTHGYPEISVLLGHRLPDDRILQTLYAGLESTEVRVGIRVARGELIGKRKDTLYFEVRQGSGIDLELEVIDGVTLNSPHSEDPFNRIDPLSLFTDEPQKPNALSVIRAQETDPDRALENIQFDPESALKFREQMRKKTKADSQ